MAVIEKNKLQFNTDIFGRMPERPLHLSVRPISVNEEFGDGFVILKEMEMELEFMNGIAKLPFSLFIPKSKEPCPAVIVINDEKGFSDKVKEWTDKGYAVLSLYYRNISENNGNFKSGISAFISPTRRKKSSAGKIAVWAWAAIRALEYAEVLDEIDKNRIGVWGKGVFGLSALVAEANCKGFSMYLPKETSKIDESFIASNPYLFSPEFLKIQFFDN